MSYNTLKRIETRQYYRAKRKQLTQQQQIQASKDVLALCLQMTPLKQVKTVACYLPNDGELDPSAVIQYCWQDKKRVLLPVLHPFTEGHLIFVEYRPDSTMRPNRYGIPEPVATSNNLCPLEQVELIFTPLVAFDVSGNRLGMGGGYYDRTLAPIRREKLPTKLFGLAHDCQQVDTLATDCWDIPLNGVATPTQFFNTNILHQPE